MLLLLVLPLSVLAQDLDLSEVRDLEEKIPSYNLDQGRQDELDRARRERRFLPPNRVVSFDKIAKSGTQLGALKKGGKLIRISDSKIFAPTRHIYLRYYSLEDEHQFKYIVDEEGICAYKVKSEDIEPIKEELALYEPPTRYTPAPDNIIKAEYDEKLQLLPEASFYAGLVDGAYMYDLFNDKEARSGVTTQYGVHLFTDWKLPVKVGGVVHYEKSTYGLTGGESVHYSSISFGPQFKSKDFELFNHPVRVQGQFRVSPFAKATAETPAGQANIKFNSADLLTSIERPVENDWGQFVLGLFLQAQWLNIRDQSEIVSVRASNEPNTSFGLSFSQVVDW